MGVRYGRLSGVGEFLDYSFKLFKHNFGRLMVISGIVNVPYLILTFWFQRPLDPSTDPSLFEATFALPVLLVGLAVAFYFGPWMMSALTLFCGNLVLHDKTLTWQEAYAKGRKYIGRVLGIAFLTGLAVAGSYIVIAIAALTVGPIGFVLVLLPVVLLIWFSLSTYAGIMEDRTATNAMGRSRELVMTKFWTVVGFFVLTGIIYLIGYYGLIFIIGMLVALLGLDGLWIGSVAVSTITVLLSLIYTSFSVVSLSVLYSQMRIRNEGLDLQSDAEALMGGSEFN